MKKKAKSKKAKPAKKARKPARKAVRPAKKKTAKKAAKPAKPKSKSKKAKAPAQAPKPGIVPPANGIEVGRVDDYYAHIGVIALTLLKGLSLHARIQLLGHTTNFEQTVESMQIDHLPVTEAAAGQGVGIKVINRARKGDHVYLLT